MINFFCEDIKSQSELQAFLQKNRFIGDFHTKHTERKPKSLTPNNRYTVLAFTTSSISL